MSDVIILWNQPLFFETMFREYGISAAVCAPISIQAPHLPPVKLLIVPAGFTFPEYSSVAEALADSKIQMKIFKFVENGGTLLIFSPLKEVRSCSNKSVVTSFEKFGIAAEFVQTDVMILKESSLLPSQDSIYCDGFFQNYDERFQVIESDESGRPVHISMFVGNGRIILSSVHEFLSKTYFSSLLEGPKVKL